MTRCRPLVLVLGCAGAMRAMTACAEIGVNDAARHLSEPAATAEDPETAPLPRERKARLYDPRSAFPRDAAPDRDD